MMIRHRVVVASVLSALSLPQLAQAEVTVYGQARMSIDSSRNGETDPKKDGSAIAVSSNVSRLGFKGGEDLGNGLRGIYQFETEIRLDDNTSLSQDGKCATDSNKCQVTGGNLFKGRNSFVGLTGEFGTVLIGRHDTPYKMSTVSHDIMADTKGDYNNLVLHDTRADNAMLYLSPDLSGFKLAAAYIPSYKNDDISQSVQEGKQKGVSASASYTAGAFDVNVAYENLQAASVDTATSFHDDKALKFAAAYKIGNTRVGVVADRRSYNGASAATASDPRERKTVWLNLQQKLGQAGSARLGYGNAGQSAAGRGDGASMITAGYFHGLSKNTEVYAVYTKVKK